MAPLILHNVPDDELYIGDDGVTRPYALVFPHYENMAQGTRSRRVVTEKGSFGRSTRRSRSKTATPARREDPTIAAADQLFGAWKKGQKESIATAPGSQESGGSQSQPASESEELGAVLPRQQSSAAASSRASRQKKRPTEVILRGYRSAEQRYAALSHYEQLAGRICEDYPREPPAESRRYKSELRESVRQDRRQPLTAEERVRVNRTDGGEHWVKVTFESEHAAEAALYASPQSIQGYLVYAEPYHGIPPPRDEPVPDPITAGRELLAAAARRSPLEASPPHSQVSSRTIDTGTMATEETIATATVSSATVAGPRSASTNKTDTSTASSSSTAISRPHPQQDEGYSKVLRGVRKAHLMSADEALLPQETLWVRLARRPPLSWLGSSIIGDEVPRTDTGEFDWLRASLYWRLIWWLDFLFRLFGGEILNADKDD